MALLWHADILVLCHDPYIVMMCFLRYFNFFVSYLIAQCYFVYKKIQINRKPKKKEYAPCKHDILKILKLHFGTGPLYKTSTLSKSGTGRLRAISVIAMSLQGWRPMCRALGQLFVVWFWIQPWFAILRFLCLNVLCDGYINAHYNIWSLCTCICWANWLSDMPLKNDQTKIACPPPSS